MSQILRHSSLFSATLRVFPIRLLAELTALHRQRQQLALLDDHMLKDIGLTAERAKIESRRPVWDVPTTWRR